MNADLVTKLLSKVLRERRCNSVEHSGHPTSLVQSRAADIAFATTHLRVKTDPDSIAREKEMIRKLSIRRVPPLFAQDSIQRRVSGAARP
jgi:hypothetical protein